MRFCAAVQASLFLTPSLGIGLSAYAATISWDRAANIKDSAGRLAGILKTRGAAGAYKFIADCYGTHSIAEKFTAGLEACIAQDYMLTEVLAAIYTAMPPEKRKQIGAVDPENLAKSFSRRVGSALALYKMTEAEGLQLKDLVEKHGLPVFAKATLPKGAN
jgi:hypothetical protein